MVLWDCGRHSMKCIYKSRSSDSGYTRVQRAQLATGICAAEREELPAPDLDGSNPKPGTVQLDRFIRTYEDKYPKAVCCLVKDREELLTFYDFPAAYWQSLRTTNPIESTFATIRHRTKRSK